MNATYEQVICEKPVIGESFPPSVMSTSMKYTGQQAPGDTAMPSMASSPASAFSIHSVPESVEFTETNPEALGGIGQEEHAIEQKAPRSMVNDTESESEDGEISTVGEISTGGNFALFMAQV